MQLWAGRADALRLTSSAHRWWMWQAVSDPSLECSSLLKKILYYNVNLQYNVNFYEKNLKYTRFLQEVDHRTIGVQHALGPRLYGGGLGHLCFSPPNTSSGARGLLAPAPENYSFIRFAFWESAQPAYPNQPLMLSPPFPWAWHTAILIITA